MRWVGIGLAATGLIIMAGYCAVRLEVSTDVTEFLSLAGGVEQARLSRKLAASELTRTMVLTVGGGTEAERLRTIQDLADGLAEHPELAWIQTGIPEGIDQAFYDLYFPRRLLFLEPHPERIAERLSDQGLAEAAAELKRQLSLPTGAFVKRTAQTDPLLAFQAALRRLQSAKGGGLEVTDDGRFVAGDHAVAFLATRHSAFETVHQRPLLEAIERSFRDANPGGRLVLEMSGVNRVALESETSIKADVTRISVISTVGIVLLFLLLFRSPRFIALGLLPLVAGVLTAVSISLLVFGKVHGITLAFGSSLIGVCIDYPVHVFNHHGLDARGRALAKVWPGLRLGALTTVAGFGGLLVTSFPGLREIAVFGVAGVLGALVATRVLSAPLLPALRQPTGVQLRAAAALTSALESLRAHPRRTLLLPGLALVLCVVGLPRLTWLDDPKALYVSDTPLNLEQLRVRDRVSRVDGARFVVALGEDLEAALRANDRVHDRLERARADGALAGQRSLHGFLWSADLQRRNWAAVQASPELGPRLLAAYGAAGFRAEAFAPFAQALSGPPPPPLTFEDLLATPLRQLVRSFVVDLDERVGVLTYLRGVKDGVALEAALSDLPGVVYLDQNLILGRAYRGYRVEVLKLVGLGLLAVLGLMLARYRKLRVTLAAFLPALLAAAATLATLSLLGEVLHLLHLTAVLMVLSIGADYGIFLAESRVHPRGIGATVLSIAIACCTTVLAFGLLALSSAPVLRAIGATIGLGVLFSLLLAPAALALSGEHD